MIYSQTFTTTPGATTVSDPSFSGATVYGVKRSGLGYTKVSGLPSGLQYALVDSYIIFDSSIPFFTGETILVLYNKQSSVVPPDCIIPSMGPGGTSDSLPNAISGVAYVFTFPLNGTAPFTLSSVVKPSWMTITVSGSNLEFTGTPGGGDIGTDIVVSFNVDNCHASALVYSDLIDVIIPAGNGAFTITNVITESGNNIKNIFPISPFYTLYSGTLPVGPGQTALGYMTSGVSDPIGVYVTKSGIFILALELYKNAVLVETVLFTTTGTYYFSLLTFTVADSMEIRLVYVS